MRRRALAAGAPDACRKFDRWEPGYAKVHVEPGQLAPAPSASAGGRRLVDGGRSPLG